MSDVTIEYFAFLKEQAGISQETGAFAGQTAGQVYAEIAKNRGFSMCKSKLTFAVNDQFVQKDHVLAAGDRLVFIPPVAGG